MLDEVHGTAVGAIANQHAAARRPLGHRAKVKHRRTGTAAIEDITRKHGESALAHGDDEIALAAERLGHGGHARQQGLVLEQRSERDRRRIEQIEAANGARAAEGRAGVAVWSSMVIRPAGASLDGSVITARHFNATLRRYTSSV